MLHRTPSDSEFVEDLQNPVDITAGRALRPKILNAHRRLSPNASLHNLPELPKAFY